MVSNVLIPNPLDSDSQYDRFYHFDVGELESDELRDELYALRPLLWGLSSGHWIRERAKVLEKELAKRRDKKWQ